MDLTDKVAAYANALDSDISAERFEQVRISVTEAIGALEIAKLEIFEGQK